MGPPFKKSLVYLFLCILLSVYHKNKYEKQCLNILSKYRQLHKYQRSKLILSILTVYFIFPNELQATSILHGIIYHILLSLQIKIIHFIPFIVNFVTYIVYYAFVIFSIEYIFNIHKNIYIEYILYSKRDDTIAVKFRLG